MTLTVIEMSDGRLELNGTTLKDLQWLLHKWRTGEVQVLESPLDDEYLKDSETIVGDILMVGNEDTGAPFFRMEVALDIDDEEDE